MVKTFSLHFIVHMMVVWLEQYDITPFWRSTGLPPTLPSTASMYSDCPVSKSPAAKWKWIHLTISYQWNSERLTDNMTAKQRNVYYGAFPLKVPSFHLWD